MYEFACPNCDTRATVDRPVQQELLANGCIFCGTSVSSSNFDRSRESG